MEKRQPPIYFLEVKKLLKDNHIDLDKSKKNILQKNNRPYYAVIKVSKNYSAFVPLRTHLKHKYGFKTKQSFDQSTNKHTHSGLDYTKALLFKTDTLTDYIKKETVIIDRNEFDKISKNPKRIHQEFKQFLRKDFFPLLHKDISKMTPNEKNLYTFSSLQYFPDVLQSIKKEQQRKNKEIPTHSNNISRNKENRPKQKQSILEQIQQAERKSAKKNRQNTPHSRTKNQNKER